MPALPSLIERLPELYRIHVAPTPSVRVEKLPGDASNRSYYRLHGSPSVIAMVLADADPHKAAAEEITKESGAITELPFTNVQRFLLSRGLPVPKLLYDGQHEGVLLLEDLGDLTLLEYAAPKGEVERESVYTQAVDQLLALQRPATTTELRECIGFRRRFDADLLYWEFHHFLEYGIEKKGVAVAADDRAVLDLAFRALADQIAAMPEVLVHRDYHSRNLMLAGGKLAIIDFQDALVGPVTYDLASLLRDSYIAVGEGIIDRLVERYRQAAVSEGLGKWGADEFREWFDLVSVQRNLKAAGRFDYIDQVKGNPKFLADIPRTLAYVKGNLAKHESLKTLRLFAKYVPALA
jgi:aminoglycoside/choline kinase family phosphotransferase